MCPKFLILSEDAQSRTDDPQINALKEVIISLCAYFTFRKDNSGILSFLYRTSCLLSAAVRGLCGQEALKREVLLRKQRTIKLWKNVPK